MRQERKQTAVATASPPPPALFLCPISLEIMRDPVIVCTGQTYDRASIEKWIRDGHRSCPITMLHLHDLTLIPNIIVRQLIEAWSSASDDTIFFDGGDDEGSGGAAGGGGAGGGGFGYEDICGNAAAASINLREEVLFLLRAIAKGQDDVRDAVMSLRSLAKKEEGDGESSNSSRDAACACIVEAGGALLLASLLADRSSCQDGNCSCCEEVMALLRAICRGGSSGAATIGAVMDESGAMESVVAHLNGSLAMGARMSAAMLLKRLLAGSESVRASVGKAPGFFKGLLDLLEEVDMRRKKSVVKALQLAVAHKPNRVRAVEQGTVVALGQLLATAIGGGTQHQLTAYERGLATIEILCTVEQGRRAASVVLPVVVRLLLGSSRMCTEHATACLLLVCQSGPVETLEIAMRAGAGRQLLLLLQSDCSGRAKRKALELLKLFHAICDTPGMRISPDSSRNGGLY